MPFELLSIPAIIAIVESMKMAGLPSRFAALVAIVCGAAFGYAVGDVLAGFVFGLASSGAYSGVKAVLDTK